MSWYFFSNSERRFASYATVLSDEIERAFLEGKPIAAFKSQDRNFEVHFKEMKQYVRSSRGGLSQMREVKREEKKQKTKRKKPPAQNALPKGSPMASSRPGPNNDSTKPTQLSLSLPLAGAPTGNGVSAPANGRRAQALLERQKSKKVVNQKVMSDAEMKQMSLLRRQALATQPQPDVQVQAASSDKLMGLFNLVDLDGDGKVSPAELLKGLHQWKFLVEESALESIMGTFGAQKDALSSSEFLELVMFLLDCRSRFQRFDKDKSNSIDHSELNAFFGEYQFNPEVTTSLMKIFDSNAKGSLSFSETVSLLACLKDLEKHFGNTSGSLSSSVDGPKFHSLLRAMNVVVSPLEATLFIEMEKVSHVNFREVIKLMARFKERQPDISRRAQLVRHETRQTLRQQPLKSVSTGTSAAHPVLQRGLTSRRMTAIRRLSLSKASRIFAVGNDVEKRIIAQCRSAMVAYRDPDFPADIKSIFPDVSKADRNVVELISADWKRPGLIVSQGAKPQLFIDDVNQGDVIQGALGDCWFLSALAVLAQHGPHLLRDLFASVHPEYGFYQVKFYKDGAWQLVTVDDRLPVSKLNGRTLFGSCRDETEFWVAIIEKAYAKLYGSYHAITAGKICDALVDLTGETSEILEVEQDDAMWETLIRNVNEGFLMGCSKHNESVDGEQTTKMGLVYNHAYGILRCEEFKGVRLICLRNPWGKFEWCGRWADGAAEWIPEFATHFSAEVSDDGTFYMCFEDWAREFNHLYVLRLYADDGPNAWARQQLKGKWTEETAGGCMNHSTWTTNPQYQFTAIQNTPMFISLTLKDRRNTTPPGSPTSYPGHGGLLLSRKSASPYKAALVTQSSSDQVVHTPAYQAVRECSFEFQAVKGSTYVLIPNTYERNILDDFFISIYSRHPIQITEVSESAPSNSISGSWVKGSTAGGCPNHSSWRVGIQFLVDVVASTTAKIPIVLEQGDIPKDKLLFIGFYIFKNADSVFPSLDMNDIVYAPSLTNSAQVAQEVELAPGKYNILPATYLPDQENTFTLRVISDKALLKPLAGSFDKKTIQSEWKDGLNGGCLNFPETYQKNPKFLMKINAPTKLTAVITQQEKSHIGFNIFKDAQTTDYLDTSPFSNATSIPKALSLTSGQYYILATTFKPRINQKFTIEVYSETKGAVSLTQA